MRGYCSSADERCLDLSWTGVSELQSGYIQMGDGLPMETEGVRCNPKRILTKEERKAHGPFKYSDTAQLPKGLALLVP